MATNPPTLLRLGLARALRSASSRSTTTRLFTTPSHAPRHRPTTTTTTTTTTSVTSATTTQNPTSPLPNPHRSISSSRTTNPPARPTHPPKTDFAELDVLANTPTPSTAVDVCYADGFALNSGVRITGGDGALLVGGEAFSWRPWEAVQQGGRLVNGRGQWEVGEEGFAVFGGLWPRPGMFYLFFFFFFVSALSGWVGCEGRIADVICCGGL